MNAKELKNLLAEPGASDLFEKLYTAEGIAGAKHRYESVIDGYIRTYGEAEMKLFSSPGRTEISGNHTDHNHGKILGASINLDCIAAAAKNEDNCVRILSETFRQSFTINLSALEPSAEKRGTEDLVKGILAGFKEKGFQVGGFNAYITSNVIASAGVSSSAAFETLLCQIINTFFNESRVDTVSYAHIGKYAENIYWNKSSGLLDQMCCAVGGLINIDFKNAENPKVNRVDFDFASSGYSLIIVQTGRGHADLSEDYSSIPKEMNKAAEYFGEKYLADIDESRFYSDIQGVRKFAGDRSVMRAIHFFEENRRVDSEVLALKNGDFEGFLKNVEASGNSSWKYLQNCYTNTSYQEQGISVALALTELFINAKGAGVCRVHGGGFAGVIMAMLPNSAADEYTDYINGHLGEGSAHRMSIRPYGSVCVDDILMEKYAG